MARAKKASDEIYNARRRAKRLIARLEREGAKSGIAGAAQRDYIRSLREQIERSYYKPVAGQTKRQIAENAQAASKKLERMTARPRAAKGATERANRIFQRQLNLARGGQPSALGTYGEQAVGVFYASTKRFWQGKDPAKRNELILKGLGVTSMEEAYKAALRANVQAFRAAIQGGAGSFIQGLTSENAAFYEEVGMDSELMGSDYWASFLHMF